MINAKSFRALSVVAVGFLIGVVGAGQVGANEPAPAINEKSVVSEKPRLTIICEGFDNRWKCDVLDNDNQSVKARGTAPKGIDTTKTKPLVQLLEADVDYVEHDTTFEMKDGVKVFNAAGPHCWVLVGGKYYQTHC